jgi:hypothetical protein
VIRGMLEVIEETIEETPRDRSVTPLFSLALFVVASWYCLSIVSLVYRPVGGP